MGLFFAHFFSFCILFYLVFSIYKKIHAKMLIKYLWDSSNKEKRKALKSIDDDADLLLMMNMLTLFIGALAIGISLTGLDADDIHFSYMYTFICVVISAIAFAILHHFYMGSKHFKKIESDYYLDLKLEEIGNLIDSLNERKYTLENYDPNDEYRSKEVVDEEIKDIELSISLLKEMYSNLELNHCINGVNRLYKEYKDEPIVESSLKEFQQKMDTVNARKMLDKNIDINLERLKEKYK